MRPWNEPYADDHVVALGPAVRLAVAARELDRALVGLGARVGEEHAPAAAEQRVEARREHAAARRCSRGSRRAAACAPGRRSRRRPPGARARATSPRGRRGSRGTACPSLSNSRVPSPRTNATGQPAVGLHHVLGVERDELVEGRRAASRPSFIVRHGCTIVPTPSRVKNSRSSACGMRPSRMWARSHAAAQRVDARRELRDHALGDLARRRRAARARRRRSARSTTSRRAKSP